MLYLPPLTHHPPRILARPVRFELTTSGFEGGSDKEDRTSLRALEGITWFESALAAYECLPLRVGEKARVSATTIEGADCHQTDGGIRSTETFEKAVDKPQG